MGHEPKIGSLKTRASVRDLPLLPSIKQELQAEYERWLYPDGDELLYLTKKDNPMDDRNFIKTFKDAARKVGLKEITLHEIRHSVATMLKEANVSAKDAQVILGAFFNNNNLANLYSLNRNRKIKCTSRCNR